MLNSLSTIVEPKRGTDVGRVVVEVWVENYEDRLRATRGEIAEGEIRRISVSVLIEPDAKFLCLPKALLESLGLASLQDERSDNGSSPIHRSDCGAARIEVQGRDCVMQVAALPEGNQSLLGRIPLVAMDWWIDLRTQQLVGNPEHGGEWMAEVF